MSVFGAKLQAAANLLGSAETLLVEGLDKLQTLTIDGERKFSPEQLLPVIDVSYSFLQDRISYLATQLRAIPDDLPDLFLPSNAVVATLNLATSIENHAKQLLAHFAAVEKAGGHKPTTWNNIEIATGDGKLALDFVANFATPILNASDRILTHIAAIAQLLQSGGVDYHAELAKVIQAARVATESETEARKQLTIAREAVERAAAAATEATKLKDSAGEIENAIKKIRDRLAAVEGDTTTKKAAADAAIQAAAALKTQVDGYAASFTAFQAELDHRTKALTQGNQDLAKLTKELQEQSAQIQVNVADATKMLASATNASLTHAQQSKYEELGTQLKSAGIWVLLAYLGLFLSVAPVVNYVSEAATIEFSSVWTYLGNVLARSVLLIPGGVAASFTTRRYMRLFRLRHEYGYRASLAGAVEGFQRQAPDHHQDIAAVAFFQLGRNPAESIDGGHEPPAWYSKLQDLLDRFSNRFGKASPAE